MEKLDELKLQAFDIRRKIDMLEGQRTQLIQQYNNIMLEINKTESKEKGNNDNGKIADKKLVDKR
jgi:hypothetical protein